MLAEIKYDLKFLQPSECVAIVEHCKQFPLERSKFGYPPFGMVDTSRRISKHARINSQDEILNSMITHRVKEYVKHANEDVFLFDIDYNNVNINFVEYDGNEKAFATRHQSVNWISDSIQNKLYLMINLSNPESFEGGENRFSFGSRDELPRRLETRNQGIMLCFPCFRYFETLPVLSGKKYVLEFFFRGPHWK